MLLAKLMTADGVIGGEGTNPSKYIEPDGRTFSYVLYKSPDGEAIGADAYCRDAAVAADTAQRLISERRATASV